MNTTRRYAIAVIAGLLSACSSDGEVARLDRDTYMVAAQSRLGGNDRAAAAVQKADAYCKERGKRMRMTGMETADGVIGVWPARNVMMFKCAD